MNLLTLLAIVSGRSPASLLALLERVAKLDSTVKPIADQWISTLETAVAPENLGTVLAVLPAEVKDLLKGHLSPSDHPSDFA